MGNSHLPKPSHLPKNEGKSPKKKKIKKFYIFRRLLLERARIPSKHFYGKRSFPLLPGRKSQMFSSCWLLILGWEGVGAAGPGRCWEEPQLEWEELEAIPGSAGDGSSLKRENPRVWSGFASRSNSCGKFFWKVEGRWEDLGRWGGMEAELEGGVGVEFWVENHG